MSMQHHTRAKHSSRRHRASRAFMILAALILFVGLFLQISMLARISQRSKQASAIEKEIAELSAYAQNLELNINQYHNLDSIAVRAQEMGMEKPDESQIRVVSVVRSNENTSIQTVEAIDGEKVLN